LRPQGRVPKQDFNAIRIDIQSLGDCIGNGGADPCSISWPELLTRVVPSARTLRVVSAADPGAPKMPQATPRPTRVPSSSVIEPGSDVGRLHSRRRAPSLRHSFRKCGASGWPAIMSVVASRSRRSWTGSRPNR
jgi:hypothetical protein